MKILWKRKCGWLALREQRVVRGRDRCVVRVFSALRSNAHLNSELLLASRDARRERLQHLHQHARLVRRRMCIRPARPKRAGTRECESSRPFTPHAEAPSMNKLAHLQPLIDAHAGELKQPGIMPIRPGYSGD
jgi:hypothetical protein